MLYQLGCAWTVQVWHGSHLQSITGVPSSFFHQQLSASQICSEQAHAHHSGRERGLFVHSSRRQETVLALKYRSHLLQRIFQSEEVFRRWVSVLLRPPLQGSQHCEIAEPNTETQKSRLVLRNLIAEVRTCGGSKLPCCASCACALSPQGLPPHSR
jgi:hypothetical protein